jgi:2-methylisocitrate lyase-like PEP mutase family enzyme
MNEKRKTARLKELLTRKGSPAIRIAPYNVNHALMLEDLGYEFINIGAGAVIGAMTGLPDNGTITMTESVTISKWYADALRIPVIVDVDACFGGILQVERAVKEFIHAGVAGIRMEDQPFLGKRFGGMVGKELLPLEEAVAKFRIAVDTGINSIQTSKSLGAAKH